MSYFSNRKELNIGPRMRKLIFLEQRMKTIMGMIDLIGDTIRVCPNMSDSTVDRLESEMDKLYSELQHIQDEIDERKSHIIEIRIRF